MSNDVQHEAALETLNWDPLSVQRKRGKQNLCSSCVTTWGPNHLLVNLVLKVSLLIIYFVVLKEP